MLTSLTGQFFSKFNDFRIFNWAFGFAILGYEFSVILIITTQLARHSVDHAMTDLVTIPVARRVIKYACPAGKVSIAKRQSANPAVTRPMGNAINLESASKSKKKFFFCFYKRNVCWRNPFARFSNIRKRYTSSWDRFRTEGLISV